MACVSWSAALSVTVCKGLSTYDYIVQGREKEEEAARQKQDAQNGASPGSKPYKVDIHRVK